MASLSVSIKAVAYCSMLFQSLVNDDNLLLEVKLKKTLTLADSGDNYALLSVFHNEYTVTIELRDKLVG